MNEVVQSMIDDVRSFESRTDQTLIALVKGKESSVIDMNVNDQLYQGLDSQGNSVAPPYAAATIRAKRRKGQPHDRVTLRDTGDFHDSFFVAYGTGEFSLTARDKKKQWLDRKYGKLIYGLTDENIDRLSRLIEGDFINEARKVILNE